MVFKDLFDKAFLTEAKIRHNLKIFYKLNLNLIKIQGTDTTTPDQMPAPAPEMPQQPVDNTAVPMDNTAGAVEQPAPEENPEPAEPTPAPGTSNNNPAGAPPGLSSVVTEEDEVSENDDNKVLRKFEGEIELTDDQADTIQSFGDIISLLSETKKDGTEILDDFCSELVNLAASNNSQQLSSMIDKKSSIFVEIYYGYKKDDSVGIRFNKRPGSDSLTSTMLIDNEIVSAPFSIDRVDRRIAEIRNDDLKH